MKKKEIGQCKDCKWGEKLSLNRINCPKICGTPFTISWVSPIFGCWYWKEKKK